MPKEIFVPVTTNKWMWCANSHFATGHLATTLNIWGQSLPKILAILNKYLILMESMAGPLKNLMLVIFTQHMELIDWMAGPLRNLHVANIQWTQGMNEMDGRTFM